MVYKSTHANVGYINRRNVFRGYWRRAEWRVSTRGGYFRGGYFRGGYNWGNINHARVETRQRHVSFRRDIFRADIGDVPNGASLRGVDIFRGVYNMGYINQRMQMWGI